MRLDGQDIQAWWIKRNDEREPTAVPMKCHLPVNRTFFFFSFCPFIEQMVCTCHACRVEILLLLT